jgi:hypothetical protein
MRWGRGPATARGGFGPSGARRKDSSFSEEKEAKRLLFPAALAWGVRDHMGFLGLKSEFVGRRAAT